jgi:hypothetical protein
MLNYYVTQVQRLLHDASAQFWTVPELTDYINQARIRLVRDTGCYRQLQTLYFSTGVEVYPFGGVTGFQITNGGTGYLTPPTVNIAPSGFPGATTATATATVTNGVVTDIVVTNPGTYYLTAPLVTFTPTSGGINAAATAYFINFMTIDAVNVTVYWGNSRRVLGFRQWSTFNAIARGWVAYLGMPTLFSVYSYTRLYIAKIPDQAYLVDLDSVMEPLPLLDDTTLEVIPIVMMDPIPYFAAHLAKIKSQKWGEADAFYQRYNQEVIKAINSSFTRRTKYPYFQR